MEPPAIAGQALRDFSVFYTTEWFHHLSEQLTAVHIFLIVFIFSLYTFPN